MNVNLINGPSKYFKYILDYENKINSMTRRGVYPINRK